MSGELPLRWRTATVRCATCPSLGSTMVLVWRVSVLCSFVILKTTLAVLTPPFKPLVPGTESVLQRFHFSEVKSDNEKVKLDHYLNEVLSQWDSVNITRGITLKRIEDQEEITYISDPDVSILDSVINFIKQHAIQVSLMDVAHGFSDNNELEETGRSARFFGGGKNTFLTGFGLGFLAFGLKKLMLPFLIGAQIFKSILLALFLPSIIGGLGKIVSKGVTNFAAGSGGNGLGFGGGQMEDFEFKDQTGYQTQHADAQADGSSSVFSYAYPNNPYSDQSNVGVLPAPFATTNSIANRYTSNAQKVSFLPNSNNHGSFYTKNSLKSNKHQDYKVFHNIPSSSLLLTNYDPFYSPLLSRMDSVFQQLSYATEPCRERLICLMYRNPAKFAPYSNLISAQLSRELNELRKPSTDNPEILRFFKYMKAAKDGQDGVDCMRAHPECYDNRESINPPMVKTYNDINKLVHARKLK